MKNKSKIIAIIAGIIAFALVSCLFRCSDLKLKASVEAFNKECPIPIGNVGQVDGVTYKDKTVEMVYVMDEQFTNLDYLSSDPEGMKISIMTSMRNDNSKQLFRMIIDAKADLSVVYKGKNTGKEARFRFTPEELQQELERPEASPEEKLAYELRKANHMMPMETGTEVLITELRDEGDAIVYMACVLDTALLHQCAANIDNIKEGQHEWFQAMDAVEGSFFNLIIAADKDLKYRYYVEGTDESFEVLHTSAELREIFK